MNVWKPRIWKSCGVWYCSYYRNSIAEAYRGSTPVRAYEAWKWRNWQGQKSLESKEN